MPMNLEEYRRRIEVAHTVTGVPTYWEALQDMTAKYLRMQAIAKAFYDNRFANDQEQERWAAAEYEKAIEEDK